jgi:hypothetical protein
MPLDQLNHRLRLLPPLQALAADSITGRSAGTRIVRTPEIWVMFERASGLEGTPDSVTQARGDGKQLPPFALRHASAQPLRPHRET